MNVWGVSIQRKKRSQRQRKESFDLSMNRTGLLERNFPVWFQHVFKFRCVRAFILYFSEEDVEKRSRNKKKAQKQCVCEARERVWMEWRKKKRRKRRNFFVCPLIWSVCCDIWNRYQNHWTLLFSFLFWWKKVFVFITFLIFFSCKNFRTNYLAANYLNGNTTSTTYCLIIIDHYRLK